MVVLESFPVERVRSCGEGGSSVGGQLFLGLIAFDMQSSDMWASPAFINIPVATRSGECLVVGVG